MLNQTIYTMKSRFSLSPALRLIMVSVLVLATVVPVGVWVVGTNAGQGLPIEKRIELVKACLIDKSKSSVEEKAPVYDVTSDVWSDNVDAQTIRNQCAVEALGLPRDGQDVSAIMTSLINAAGEDEDVQVACHEIGHELGMRTWRELGPEGLVLGLELCTYGFYHGYMRAAITSEGGRDRVPFLVKFCDLQARELGDFNAARLDFCAHGVGHAIGSAKWGLAESVELCGAFPLETQPDPVSGFTMGGVAGWCSTGVFNEWFMWPWPKGFKTVSDGMKTCDLLPSLYDLHCAQYVVHNSMLDLDLVKKECPDFEGARQVGCWQGAVQILIRKVLFPNGENRGLSNYTNPAVGAKLIDDVCALDDTGNCARQFAADSMSTTQSPSLVLGVCEKMARPLDREKCAWQVEGIRSSGIKYLD